MQAFSIFQWFDSASDFAINGAPVDHHFGADRVTSNYFQFISVGFSLKCLFYLI